MGTGSLAVVDAWLNAVNRRDADALQRLTHTQVQIAGPRGNGIMDRAVLADWLARAGFSADQLRWFCGGDGSVVVEQDARWTEVSSNDELGRACIASRFVIRDGRVASYQRHDDGLRAALTAAGLSTDDEVLDRAHH
ncbi:hypothetical protein C8N24_6395 [Solirubrobacter pauli]|uniref:SnoaL-like protein n=1 Tax=Solirubrobacter pauli TaxID=166793 RepID=A0A660L8W0_9ACTN|nr:hypothetical protein [Solirubrobacter pauli]RKQ88353.1 hypothetical protein C8N24_6395 [Solirubrobacter pauli]